MEFARQAADRYETLPEQWYLEQQARRLDRIIEVLRLENARGPLVEFGALGGGFALSYSTALGMTPDQITCSDFTDAQLDRARERGFRTVRWILGDQPRPEELAPGSFNTVLFCEILEHLVNPEEALKPVVELLAPGGLLLVTTPNLASLGNRLRLLRGRSPSLAPAPGMTVRAPGSLATHDHLRVCVAEEWIHLLRSFGLDVTRVEGATNGPRQPDTTRHRVSLMVNRLLERRPWRLWMTTLLVARRPR